MNLELTTLTQLVGNTPLVRLENFSSKKFPNIFAKLEMFNPTGSIKDRIALYMINIAEREKILFPGSVIVEASSGNTGASLALIAARKGYRCLITTSEKTSFEKICMMRALGAEVKVCPNILDTQDKHHYVNFAKIIAEQIPHSYLVDQYNNINNILAHYHTTGPEIWEQTCGKIDYLFACGSSGGTISGTGKYLKEKNPNLKVILADPVGSIYYDYFKEGKINIKNISSYKVEGAGKDTLCECMDFSVIDDVVQFTDDEAFTESKEIALKQGLLVGGSSGGVAAVAKKVAQSLSPSMNCVVIFADSGLKYVNKIWMSNETSSKSLHEKIIL